MKIQKFITALKKQTGIPRQTEQRKKYEEKIFQLIDQMVDLGEATKQQATARKNQIKAMNENKLAAMLKELKGMVDGFRPSGSGTPLKLPKGALDKFVIKFH